MGSLWGSLCEEKTYCKTLGSLWGSLLGSLLLVASFPIAKLTKEGEAESKACAKYVEWCDHMSMDAGFSIETSVDRKVSLEAKIGQLTSAISVAEGHRYAQPCNCDPIEGDSQESCRLRSIRHHQCSQHLESFVCSARCSLLPWPGPS